MFGIRKNSVDKLVSEIKWDFLSKKNELEYELQAVKSENEKLQNRLQELDKKSFSHQEELWKSGKERIQKVINLLSKEKEIEIMELRRIYAERTHRNDQKLQYLNVEIEESEALLQNMLNYLTSMAEQATSNQRESQVEEKLSSIMEPERSMLLDNHEGNVATIALQSEGDMQKQEDESSQEVVKEEVQEHVLTDRMEKEPSPSQNQERMQTEYVEEEDGFWGESDGVNTHNDALVLSDDLFINMDKEFNQNILNHATTSQREQVETPRQAIDSAMKEEGSNELIEQIDSIKSQYMVGKVAGNDLFDLQGNLIIAKSSVITREIVERANRAGKLADLIVNMKIAELEEEKDARE